ncbi:MAG: hypothetical protein ACTSPD_10365 [Promethearchaeota archaeon]
MLSQEIPFVCPNCDYSLDKKHIVAICDYPIELFRGLIKQGKAYKFECPKCFEISYLHKNEENL